MQGDMEKASSRSEIVLVVLCSSTTPGKVETAYIACNLTLALSLALS